MSKNYGIRVISDICNVQPHTIRMWEKRYGAFSPIRDIRGQRVYGHEDLSRAKAISLLISQGQTISKVAQLSIEELNEQVSSLNVPKQERVDAYINLGVKNLLKYLKEYQIEKVTEEIQYLRLSSSSKDFVFKVVLPTMQEIGTLVAQGVYTITQEHIISTIIRDQLGQIRIPIIASDKRYILATPEGNLHELSILIADVLCRANRITTYYLGAANPADCLGEAVNALKCNTIVMGAVSSDKWVYEECMIPYLEKLDGALKREVEVILGGAEDLDFPEFKFIKKVSVIKDFHEFDSKYLL